MMSTQPVVHTNSGPIKGRSRITDVNKEYFSFQNIPYVKKFNNETRFKDAEPIEVWTEILDATEEGPAFYNIDPFRDEDKLCEGTLDSLGINIFTPDLTPTTPLPVLVYIHGGAFINGSSSTAIYGPDYLIEHDIIMVSFNYRLNIFGFLSFNDPKLGIPGNAGLKDQNLALKWIKDNISYFGGDSNNITLCGESAGGASVNYHLISPMSQNLFNRAIIMSASAFSPWASIPFDYEKYMSRLMTKLDINNDSNENEIFRRICETEPEKLLKHTLDIVEFDDKFFGSLLLSPFLPRIERYDNGNCFLPDSVENLSKNAWSRNIDVMIGGCSDEGIFYHYCNPSDDKLSKVNQDHSLLLPLELQKQFKVDEKIEKGHAIKELYFGTNDITKDKAIEYCMYIADKLTWYPKFRTMQHRQSSNTTSNTFLYRIDLPPSRDVPEYYDMLRTLCNVPHRNGTGHTEDLPLLFKTQIARRFKPGDDHYNSWQKFLLLFTNFIKTGNPNINVRDIEQWNPISKSPTTNESLHCLEMNTKSIWKMHILNNVNKLNCLSKLYDDDDDDDQ